MVKLDTTDDNDHYGGDGYGDCVTKYEWTSGYQWYVMK